ncbi:MAG: TetR/AcrR family transcriptional regulator [Micrococcales bacterium]|nr:TetR/AcrR family transcriptional regulator [Micrococcales bacterium]
MSRPGLRESKRAETERGLASIAHRLVRERGFADVTVEEIVEEARVSRRTFSNYFSCKEEAVAAVVIHGAADGLASWDPASTPRHLVDLVRDLVHHQFGSGALASLADVSSLADGHHQLLPYVREAQWRLWAMAGERVLEELDDADDPVRRAELNALLGAVFGVVSSLFPGEDGSGTAEPARALQLLEHVLGRLEGGFGR